jgi:hypothetical protein
MGSNLDIDQRLLARALKAGGHKTKRDTVNKALRVYIRRRAQMDVVDLFGTVSYRDDYDYEVQRRRNSGRVRKRERK